MLIRAYNRRRNLAVLLAKEQEAQGSQAGDGHTGNGDQREVVRRLRDGCRRLGGRGRCTVGRGVVRRVICGIVTTNALRWTVCSGYNVPAPAICCVPVLPLRRRLPRGGISRSPPTTAMAATDFKIAIPK